MDHGMPIGALLSFLDASCCVLSLVSITFQFLPLGMLVAFGAFSQGFQRLGRRFLRES